MLNKITRYRRHRFALPAILLVALITTGATFSLATALTSSSNKTSFSRSTIIEEGKEIFLRGCSSCHGLNAEGTKRAPSLIGVGSAAVDFQVGTGRMPMGDMSQQAIRKPPVYTAQEIAALAAWVQSLAPGPEIPDEQMLATNERNGDTAQGGTLFRTNCAMCHNFAGQGGALTRGKFAPTVMGADAKQIYEAMITGPQSMPIFNDKTLTPAEKINIIKWIKSSQNEKQIGGTSLGRVGPVTEGLLAWIVGLGAIIGIAVWLASKAR